MIRKLPILFLVFVLLFNDFSFPSLIATTVIMYFHVISELVEKFELLYMPAEQTAGSQHVDVGNYYASFLTRRIIRS